LIAGEGGSGRVGEDEEGAVRRIDAHQVAARARHRRPLHAQRAGVAHQGLHRRCREEPCLRVAGHRRRAGHHQPFRRLHAERQLAAGHHPHADARPVEHRRRQGQVLEAVDTRAARGTPRPAGQPRLGRHRRGAVRVAHLDARAVHRHAATADDRVVGAAERVGDDLHASGERALHEHVLIDGRRIEHRVHHRTLDARRDRLLAEGAAMHRGERRRCRRDERREATGGPHPATGRHGQNSTVSPTLGSSGNCDTARRVGGCAA
jgi:hypothetical protein